ncbi:hypothetical protein [Acetobacter sp. DmW_043]|uniref:hypothetical protein n=1 Tax=Acetobacter sp. DmW_043 TaxID=1670658 RepID=UPI000A3A6FB6|nr:hypothetical protein [Acetobacter sp. DmW_043]
MKHPGIVIAGRTTLALFGGYFAASSVFVFSDRFLISLGLPRAEAVSFGMMCVFITYLFFILWVFAVRNLWLPFFVFFVLINTAHRLSLYHGHGG